MTHAPTPTAYVLVWRESDASRLRTYTSSAKRPLASPLSNVHPTPETVIDNPDDLNAWLNSPADDAVVAISETLARTELGWDPEPSLYPDDAEPQPKDTDE